MKKNKTIILIELFAEVSSSYRADMLVLATYKMDNYVVRVAGEYASSQSLAANETHSIFFNGNGTGATPDKLFSYLRAV